MKMLIEKLKKLGFEIYEDKDCIDACDNILKIYIVFLHDDTHNKWMLRISTMAAFDRWANSTPIEEFFDSEVQLEKYVLEHWDEILYELIEYLSEEYYALDNANAEEILDAIQYDICDCWEEE